MNYYLKAQIENMKSFTTTFKNACQLAVMQNDGSIDKEEAKILKKISKATERYVKELNSILK
ncbi:MAG: hypothetical protein IJN67_13325 [Oscillospiraceae bacterium]|nr:hypothetical protein [Oscillospiraceae bacterium]